MAKRKKDTLMVVDIEWKQLNEKGLGRYYIAEKDFEKLEDEYGSTYYFEYYDDSDDIKMRVPYAKMKKILDKEMKDKGLMDSYFYDNSIIGKAQKGLEDFFNGI